MSTMGSKIQEYIKSIAEQGELLKIKNIKLISIFSLGGKRGQAADP